jgi:PhzF family phenazine biosynthesis protein
MTEKEHMPSTRIIKQVDAFTSRPFMGNPAGVVPVADGLTDAEMQLIAREMSLPETAFVLSPRTTASDIWLRWFTPTSEIDLCGHATIGTFYALAEEGLFGMLTDGTYAYRVDTRSGILRVTVQKRAGSIDVEFQVPVPVFRSVDTLPKDIESALRVGPGDRHDRLKAMSANYLYVPLRSRDAVDRLKPDMTSLGEATMKHGWPGVSLFTTDVVDKGSAVYSRFFAPGVGIPEDPVTGSANGPLGAYLHMFAAANGVNVPSVVRDDGRTEYRGEQGDAMGRPGRVAIRVKGAAPTVEDVAIAGRAVTVMQATMFTKE